MRTSGRIVVVVPPQNGGMPTATPAVLTTSSGGVVVAKLAAPPQCAALGPPMPSSASIVHHPAAASTSPINPHTPRIMSFNPPMGARDVAPGGVSAVSVQFDRPMDMTLEARQSVFSPTGASPLPVQQERIMWVSETELWLGVNTEKLNYSTKYGLQLNSTSKAFIRSKAGVPLQPQVYFFETGPRPATYMGQSWPQQTWPQQQQRPPQSQTAQQWQQQPNTQQWQQQGWQQQEQYAYTPQYTQPASPQAEPYHDWSQQYPQAYAQPQYAPQYTQAQYQQYPQIQASYQPGEVPAQYPGPEDPQYQQYQPQPQPQPQQYQPQQYQLQPQYQTQTQAQQYPQAYAQPTYSQQSSPQTPPHAPPPPAQQSTPSQTPLLSHQSSQQSLNKQPSEPHTQPAHTHTYVKVLPPLPNQQSNSDQTAEPIAEPIVPIQQSVDVQPTQPTEPIQPTHAISRQKSTSCIKPPSPEPAPQTKKSAEPPPPTSPAVVPDVKESTPLSTSNSSSGSSSSSAASSSSSSSTSSSSSAASASSAASTDSNPQSVIPVKVNKPVFSPPPFVIPPQNSTSQLIIKPDNLAFGCETEPGAVDKELHDVITVKNNGPTMFIAFHLPQDDRFTISVDTPSLLLKKGKEVKINLTLKVICSMTVDVNVCLLSSGAKKKFKTLTEAQAEFCNKIHVCLSSALSTHLNYMDLIFEEPIGEGSFATVWRGKYHHAAVAIKYLKDQHPTDNSLLEFKREVTLMTQLRHSQIVNFIGAVSVAEKLCLVTEYMPYGSLTSVLKKRKGMDWGLKVKIAHDVATGMAYLHGNSMVHRDLKPDNVLVVSLDKHAQTTCKVSDFGTSRAVGTRVIMTDTSNVTATSDRQMTLLIGTPTYMAPEILHKEEYGPPADVFSFGVMLWQLYTEATPYSTVPDFYEFVVSGKREPIPADCPTAYAQLIASAWSQKPDDRPTFAQALEILEAILNKELEL
ncbi:tyrosine protein kinase [Pelomyxa schiedti]|nr:tyrosine protein kinase [Pelomyxa schiedti]